MPAIIGRRARWKHSGRVVAASESGRLGILRDLRQPMPTDQSSDWFAAFCRPTCDDTAFFSARHFERIRALKGIAVKRG